MSLEDLIDNIGTQNFAKANGVFDDLIKSKMGYALDAEQIRLANTVFNGGPEDDDDIDADDIEWEDGDISEDDDAEEEYGNEDEDEE